jgi:hypothetical protein
MNVIGESIPYSPAVCPPDGQDIMWANLHPMFWLSRIPFVTGWVGENHLRSCRARVAGARSVN